MAQRMKENGIETKINWIPSHIGLQGNEKADNAAKQAIHCGTVHYNIRKSLGQIKKQTTRQVNYLNLNNHKRHLNSSQSARWYQKATEYKPNNITKTMPAKLQNIILRLRLGFQCTWQKINNASRDPCNYCDEQNDLPLLHYLLQCEATSNLRQTIGIARMSPSDISAEDTATHMIQKIVSKITQFEQFLLRISPPR